MLVPLKLIHLGQHCVLTCAPIVREVDLRADSVTIFTLSETYRQLLVMLLFSLSQWLDLSSLCVWIRLVLFWIDGH